MTSSRASVVIRHLRKVLADPTTATDWQLLERFVCGHDEAAFEALMRRHAALVFGVCERSLGHTQDAEDVFQATFMVLARKANSIRRHRAVGSWLYGVAHRLAQRTKVDAARRRRRELAREVPRQRDPLEELTGRELCRVVDEELAALSERYRAPLLLCYLQAQTQEEAARQLGWSTRTLRRRLERGRELLHARLTRRGLALSAALLGTLLTAASGSSAAVADLARATLKVVFLGGGNQAAGITAVSLHATALADGLIRALFVAKLQAVSVAVLTLGIVVAGAGLWVRAPATVQPAPAHLEGRTHVATRPLVELPTKSGSQLRTDHYGDPLPPGAQVRFGTTRLRVGNMVHSSFAFAPDGKTLAAGGGRDVRVWDVATGKTTLCLEAPGERILAIAFAPDGKTLAAGGLDGMIRVWDLGAGMPRREFRGHERDVFGLVFSPDGQNLVSGGTDRTLRLWKVATGEACGQFEVGPAEGSHSSEDRSPITWPIAFFPDNRTIATKDWQQRVRLWDASTGQELRRFDWLPHPLSAVALAPDGTVVATAAQDQPVIRLWQVASGQELRQLDGHRDQVGALGFCANGSVLASAGEDGTIRLWQVATGAELCQARTDQAGAHGLAFSPDGGVLASGVNTAVRLWKTATGEELLPSGGHLDGILAIAFGSDDQCLISAGMRGTVCLWDPATGRQLGARTQLQREDALAGAFSPDGRLLALGDTHGVIRVSDVETGKDLCRWQGHKDWVFRLAFGPDGKSLASGGHDKTRALWEPLTGREIARFTKDQDDIGSVAFSPNAMILAHGCEDGTILLFDTSTGKVWSRFRSGPHPVRALIFSPDGKTLASATTAQASENGPGTVSLWEMNTGQARWHASISDGRTHCLTFSPDGRILALGSGDHQIHRWELSTGQELAPLSGHIGAVRCLAYSQDGALLASGSTDATVLVWKRPHARPGQAMYLPGHELTDLWNDLASADAERAYRAIWCLAGTAGQAVPLLEARLRERFTDARRQGAAESGRPESEKESAEQLRTLRAVEVLELVATSAARRLLAILSQDAAGTQAGAEAQAALERLDRRSTGP